MDEPEVCRFCGEIHREGDEAGALARYIHGPDERGACDPADDGADEVLDSPMLMADFLLRSGADCPDVLAEVHEHFGPGAVDANGQSFADRLLDLLREHDDLAEMLCGRASETFRLN